MDNRVERSFLLDQWTKAVNGDLTGDCRTGDCQGCGICDFSILRPIVHEHASEEGSVTQKTPFQREDMYQWLGLTYSKRGDARYFGHLELSNIFIRAIRRAKISVKYSRGYHPMPKLSFDDPLPLGMESEAESFRLLVSEKYGCDQVMRLLNEQLPHGLKLHACHRKSKERILPDAGETHFRIDFQKEKMANDRLELFNASDDWPYQRINRKGHVHQMDLKAAVKMIEVTDETTLHMVLRNDSGHVVRPVDVLTSVFKLTEEQLKGLSMIKLERRDEETGS
jgi:radical SAM-linked protein